MPRTSGVSAIAPARPVPATRLSINQVLNSIDLADVHNRAVPSFTYCQTGWASGKHIRSALGHATSISYDVMAKERGRSSRRHAEALNRSMIWLGQGTGQKFGNIVLNRLAALGELHGAVSFMLEKSPADSSLLEMKAGLEKIIVKLGVKSGKCKEAPNGGSMCSRTSKVASACHKAGEYFAECGARIDRQRLFESIGQVFLARPMAEALAERVSLPGADSAVDYSANLCAAVEPEPTRITEAVISHLMDVGTSEHVQNALLEVLKLPEYVTWRRAEAVPRAEV